MKWILTTRQMRHADAVTVADGVSVFDLMQRAGQAVAETARKVAPDTGRIVIVAGSGNNGGDGYAAARVLSDHNARVTVVALSDPGALDGAVAEHARLAAEAGAKIRPALGSGDAQVLSCWLSRSVMVIDAIFGTGLSRPLEGWMAQAVGIINTSDRPVLALDIASGINSDSGCVMGSAVKAAWTLPIAADKWGHWLAEGRSYSGEVLAPAKIGISQAVLSAAYHGGSDEAGCAELLDDGSMRFACRDAGQDAHKGDFGHVWIFGGSVGYAGAPQLAATGAMAVHAGLVSIACPDEVWPVIAAASLEVMVHRQQEAPWQHADIVVAGPGWGMEHKQMLESLILGGRPLLLDADALNMIASDHSLLDMAAARKALTVFTPHPGEAGRLLGSSGSEVQRARPGALLELVKLLKGWVVLKGAQTLIASPNGNIRLCPFGNQRLAIGGTGDVLAGMIAGLLAQGLDVGQAIGLAVVLHARAGESNGWHRAGQLADRVAALREGGL